MNNTSEGKNILCVFGSSVQAKSGTPHRIRNIVKSIAKHSEHSVTLASADRDVNIDFVDHITLNPSGIRQSFLKLRNFIQDENIDIVIGHTMGRLKVLAMLKLTTGIKLITESHSFREENGRYLGKISWLRYIRNKIIYSLYYVINDGVITVSKNAEDYISYFNKNTLVVFGAVDASLFNPDAGKMDLGFHKDSIVIGYAGNTRAYQGVQTVINHFERFVENYSQFRLALLLSDNESHSLDIAKPNKVKTYGPIEYENVPAFLNSADALIVPRLENRATRYAFPSKLFDCLGVGKPTIASATRDMKQVIKHGVNGLLYDMDRYQSFHGCCKEVINPERREEIGNNALELVRKTYSWKHQGKRISEFISNI